MIGHSFPWRRVVRLGPATWLDLLQAAYELAQARRLLGEKPGRELLLLARRRTPQSPIPSHAAHRIVDRVSFAIQHVAPRVPWRADCFVRALAAQSWLASAGVATELFIGVRQDSGCGFEAHAWLRFGERIVTGGDISGYAPLVTPSTRL